MTRRSTAPVYNDPHGSPAPKQYGEDGRRMRDRLRALGCRLTHRYTYDSRGHLYHVGLWYCAPDGSHIRMRVRRSEPDETIALVYERFITAATDGTVTIVTDIPSIARTWSEINAG